MARAVGKAKKFRKAGRLFGFDAQQRSQALLQALAGAQVVESMLKRAASFSNDEDFRDGTAQTKNKAAKPSRAKNMPFWKVLFGCTSDAHNNAKRKRPAVVKEKRPAWYSRALFEKRAALAHFAQFHGDVFGKGLTKARCHTIRPIAERYTRASYNEFVWLPFLFYVSSVALALWTDNGGGFLLCALWASSSASFGLLDSLRACDATGAITVTVPQWIEVLDSNVVYCVLCGLGEVVMTGGTFRHRYSYYRTDDEIIRLRQLGAVFLGSTGLLQRFLAYIFVQDQIGMVLEKALDGVQSLRTDQSDLHHKLFEYVAREEEAEAFGAAAGPTTSKKSEKKTQSQKVIDDMTPVSKLQSTEENSEADDNFRCLVMAKTIKNCLTCSDVLAGSWMVPYFTDRVFDKLHHDRHNEPAAAELLAMETDRIFIHAIDHGVKQSVFCAQNMFAERMPQPIEQEVYVYTLELMQRCLLEHINICLNARISTSRNWISDTGAIDCSTPHGRTAVICNFLTITQATLNAVRLAEIAICEQRPIVEPPMRPDDQAAHYLIEQELAFLDIIGSHTHARQQRQLRSIVNGRQSPIQRGVELRKKTAALVKASVRGNFSDSWGGSLCDVPAYSEMTTSLQNRADSAWKRIRKVLLGVETIATDQSVAADIDPHANKLDFLGTLGQAKFDKDTAEKAKKAKSDFGSATPLERLLLRLIILNESMSSCDTLLTPKITSSDNSSDATSVKSSSPLASESTASSDNTLTRLGNLDPGSSDDAPFKRLYVIFGQEDVHPLDELNDMSPKRHTSDLEDLGDQAYSLWSMREALEIRLDPSTHEAYVLLDNKNEKPDIMVRCVLLQPPHVILFHTV